MRMLDLFCGAGGAATGYFRAGITDITGIDNRPQPRYPFTFIQANALDYINHHAQDFDVIHASPPCQAYTAGNRHLRAKGLIHPPDLVAPTRRALQRTGKPYVIENVPGAPLHNPVMLCGTMFDLRVIRHRLFEIHPPLLILTPPCNHQGTVRGGDYAGVYGCGHNPKAQWPTAMGIDWMTTPELTQAIPPAYTEFIGRHLIRNLATTQPCERKGTQ